MGATINQVPAGEGVSVWKVQDPESGYTRVQSVAGGPVDVPRGGAVKTYATLGEALSAHPTAVVVDEDGTRSDDET